MSEAVIAKNSRIFVAGHSGLLGSAIVRRLQQDGFENLLLRSRADVDLINQSAVDSFFLDEQPEYVFLAAAKVGGIHANSTYPAEFLRENLALQTNVIHSAWQHGVRKLCFLGSSCIYPKLASQPLKEEYLLTGSLESTNEWYAIAKIAGIKMCEAYRRQYGFNAISLMPTNLYGPGDNFDLANSHVLPAMIRKIHEAKLRGDSEYVMWGTGTPMREFLHVDDMADASVFLMKNYSEAQFLNVGVGHDISIMDLAKLVSAIIGFEGRILTDPSKPDGTPRKLMDVSRLHELGWRARIPLRQGIEEVYAWYIRQLAKN